MGPTRLRRPPAPSAAERARSLVARGGTASLLGARSPATRPVVHHVWANGSAVLLVDDDDPVLEEVASDAERRALDGGGRVRGRAQRGEQQRDAGAGRPGAGGPARTGARRCCG